MEEVRGTNGIEDPRFARVFSPKFNVRQAHAAAVDR